MTDVSEITVQEAQRALGRIRSQLVSTLTAVDGLLARLDGGPVAAPPVVSEIIEASPFPEGEGFQLPEGIPAQHDPGQHADPSVF